MNVVKTTIDGLVILEPQVFYDDRGFFMETYNAEVFARLGLPTNFQQDNFSFSKRGVLRGLHFQLPPKAMSKLVRCQRGRIWDVAVDLRRSSPTYMQSFGIELSGDQHKFLFIPEGFAHGFYALEDSEVVYKSTQTYDKDLDANLAWNDPDLKIRWPLAPLLSARDQVAPGLKDLNLPF
jgi:dTDP-4-dehydrorhamnose 3,5-epimerase